MEKKKNLTSCKRYLRYRYVEGRPVGYDPCGRVLTPAERQLYGDRCALHGGVDPVVRGLVLVATATAGGGRAAAESALPFFRGDPDGGTLDELPVIRELIEAIVAGEENREAAGRLMGRLEAWEKENPAHCRDCGGQILASRCFAGLCVVCRNLRRDMARRRVAEYVARVRQEAQRAFQANPGEETAAALIRAVKRAERAEAALARSRALPRC